METIIFDCDGVLVDSEVIYKSSERAFLEKVGLTYEPAEFFRRFMGRSEDSFFEEVANDHMMKHGLPLPDDFRPSLLAFQKAEFERNIQAVPGIPEMLAELDGSIPWCVASSSPTGVLNLKLQKTGLKSYFGDKVYSAQMVRHGKPEPDLFLHAAEQTGFKPYDCIVVEDSENGVTAGLRAGMEVIGFCGGGHCPEGHDRTLKKAGAHMVVRNAEELGILLKDLFKRERDEQTSLA